MSFLFQHMEGREGGMYINSTEMTTTIIKVNNEILTYSSKEYLARDEEEAKQKLIKYGVTILPDKLSKGECARMNEGMWNTVEYLTKHLLIPVNRTEKNSYRAAFVAAFVTLHCFFAAFTDDAHDYD